VLRAIFASLSKLPLSGKTAVSDMLGVEFVKVWLFEQLGKIFGQV